MFSIQLYTLITPLPCFIWCLRKEKKKSPSKMTKKRSNKTSSSLQWCVVAALVLQNLVISVMSDVSVEDQKNYYLPTPDPNARPPPIVSYTPPAHGSSAPHHGTPPSNCGNPPASGGGSSQHHHNPSPSGGGSGYYHSPPTTTPAPPVTTTPTPPVIVTPPIIPAPTTPGITIPSPPFSFDPNSPPFTCPYWRNHPALIWAMLGWFGTIGSAFGTTSLPGFAPQTNLLQVLSNTRTDGFGELYREGTAALLNSMADHTRYPYSTAHVRDSFVAALGSNQAAMAQARLFKMANEGRIKPVRT